MLVGEGMTRLRCWWRGHPTDRTELLPDPPPPPADERLSGPYSYKLSVYIAISQEVLDDIGPTYNRGWYRKRCECGRKVDPEVRNWWHEAADRMNRVTYL